MRHQELNHVRGVSAQHHEFAMGHIDDSHHAEGNGQPHRHQDENRSLTEAIEQRLNRGIKSTRMLDGTQRCLRGGADPRVGFCDSAVGSRLHQRYQPIVNIRIETTGDGGHCTQTLVGIVGVEIHHGHADFDFSFDRRVPLVTQRLAQYRVRLRIGRTQHRLDRVQTNSGIRTVEVKSGQRYTQRLAQLIVGGDFRETIRRFDTNRCSGHGVGEAQPAVVSGVRLRDQYLIVRIAKR